MQGKFQSINFLFQSNSKREWFPLDVKYPFWHVCIAVTCFIKSWLSLKIQDGLNCKKHCIWKTFNLLVYCIYVQMVLWIHCFGTNSCSESYVEDTRKTYTWPNCLLKKRKKKIKSDQTRRNQIKNEETFGIFLNKPMFPFFFYFFF